MKWNSIFSIVGALIIMSVVTVISGCKQANSASNNTPMLALIDIPLIDENKLNGLWEIKIPNDSRIYYAFKESTNNTIYVAITNNNGANFYKIPNMSITFIGGRIVITQNGHTMKYAVKENGITLELYPMQGDKAVNEKSHILKKDTDSGHATWGNSIKTAH